MIRSISPPQRVGRGERHTKLPGPVPRDQLQTSSVWSHLEDFLEKVAFVEWSSFSCLTWSPFVFSIVGETEAERSRALTLEYTDVAGCQAILCHFLAK